jgi:hypothetical protein
METSQTKQKLDQTSGEVDENQGSGESKRANGRRADHSYTRRWGVAQACKGEQRSFHMVLS